MKVDGKVGRISVGKGTDNPLRLDPQGGLMVAGYGGEYAEAALAGRLFSVANQAAVATTANVATTWTGLGVGNPAGSGKNLIIHEFGYSVIAVPPAETTIGLMSGPLGDMAQALTAKCAMNGAGTSIAHCDDGATVGTPVLERIFATQAQPANTAVQISINPIIYKLHGSLIIPQGRAALSYTYALSAACASFYFLWEEVTV